MAWARVTHRYASGDETEFCCGTDGAPAFPDELGQLASEALRMYRSEIGETPETPDVLRDEGGEA